MTTVNPGFTPERPRAPVETDRYARFVRRILRAYGRRVGRGDIDAITEMAAMVAELNGFLADAVAGLREKGYSWAEIAARLGVTRQAAYQRWGRAALPVPDDLAAVRAQQRAPASVVLPQPPGRAAVKAQAAERL